MESAIQSFELGPENEPQLLKQFKSFQWQYLTVYLAVMGNMEQNKKLRVSSLLKYFVFILFLF